MNSKAPRVPYLDIGVMWLVSRISLLFYVGDLRSILLVAGSWFWSSMAHLLMWGDSSWLANTSASYSSKVHYRIAKNQPLAPILSNVYSNPPSRSLFLEIQLSVSPHQSLDLPSGSAHQTFRSKSVRIHSFSLLALCPANPILLDLKIVIILMTGWLCIIV